MQLWRLAVRYETIVDIRRLKVNDTGPQWPRGLRRVSEPARFAGFLGSNLTDGMDVCLL